jgi:hypothetical protein
LDLHDLSPLPKKDEMRKGLKIKYRRRRERKEVEKDTDNCRTVFFSFG